MASDRELIVVQSPVSAGYIVAYEGTNGQIPFDLVGEYTSQHLAMQAISLFKLRREALKAATKKKGTAGDVSGNTE